jgi:hypothetical protein
MGNLKKIRIFILIQKFILFVFPVLELKKKERNLSKNSEGERKLSFNHNPVTKKKTFFQWVPLLEKNSLNVVFPPKHGEEGRSSSILILWIRLSFIFCK